MFVHIAQEKTANNIKVVKDFNDLKDLNDFNPLICSPV